MQSIDIELWYIMNEDPYEATIESREIGRTRVKTRSELSAQDKINLTLNVKVMNLLYSTLDANESTRVKGCKTTKEM